MPPFWFLLPGDWKKHSICPTKENEFVSLNPLSGDIGDVAKVFFHEQCWKNGFDFFSKIQNPSFRVVLASIIKWKQYFFYEHSYQLFSFCATSLLSNETNLIYMNNHSFLLMAKLEIIVAFAKWVSSFSAVWEKDIFLFLVLFPRDTKLV